MDEATSPLHLQYPGASQPRPRRHGDTVFTTDMEY